MKRINCFILRRKAPSSLTRFAGFLFHTVPDSERLSKGDAAFVDVIHSAGLWIGTDEVVRRDKFFQAKECLLTA